MFGIFVVKKFECFLVPNHQYNSSSSAASTTATIFAASKSKAVFVRKCAQHVACRVSVCKLENYF